MLDLMDIPDLINSMNCTENQAMLIFTGDIISDGVTAISKEH